MSLILESGKKQVEEEIAHFGVKGMHWGVRKGDISGAAKSAVKALGRGADVTAFELSKNSDWVRNDITNRAHDKTLADLPAIKAKHGDYGKLQNRAKKPFSPEARAYRDDVKKTFLKHLESSANERTNFSGSRRYTLKESGKPNTSRYFWSVSTEKNPAKHAAGSDTAVFHPVFDNEGYIVDIPRVSDSMAQTAIGEQVTLAHFGVKGMHWGVRRSREVSTQTQVDTGLVKRQTKIKATGGEAHPAHPDAVKAAEQQQKLKKSGSAALSNQELRDLITRRQLEAQVSSATTKKGRRFAQRQLEISGQQQVQKGLARGGHHAIRKASRGAAAVATTAALL